MSPRVPLWLLVAALALLAWLIASVGPWRIASMIVRIGWSFPLVAAIYGVNVSVRAAALWRSVPGRRVRYVNALRIWLSGESVEWLTFTGPFLAEPAKGWLLSSSGLPATAGFATVVTEYLISTVTSSLLGVLAIALLLSGHLVDGTLRAWAVGIATVMVAFVSAFTFAAISGIGLIGPSLRAMGAVVGRRAELAAEAFRPVEAFVIGVIHERPILLATVFSLEAAAQLVLIVEIRVIVSALGFQVGWLSAVMLEGSVKFVGLAFAYVPGQIGVSEGVYATLAGILGLSPAAGVSLALVRRFRGIVVATIGLIVLPQQRLYRNPASHRYDGGEEDL